MSLAIRNAEVELRDGVLLVGTELMNESAEAWRSAEGWAAGYHLFDDAGGTLIVDGERRLLDLPAGQTAPVRMSVATPPEPGDYSVYISVVRENVAWFYDLGWPFLLIRFSVSDEGVATLRGWRVTDMRSVRARLFARSLGRAFYLPFQTIWRQRNLIRTLVRRDILSRYTGSFGGALWTVLNPLLLMLTYFFVFGIVMKSKLGNDSSRTGFALYFLAGMLPWLAFSEAAGRAPFIMLEHRNFIRKLVFPVETLPVNVVVAGLVTEFFGLLLFTLALLAIRHGLPWTLVYLPLILVPQILLTAGVAWFLAALSVFARDLGQIIGYLLTVLMFITPIFYSEQNLPEMVSGVLRRNPIFVLVHSYRAVLLEKTAPPWHTLGWLTLAALAAFLLGHASFYKLRKSFADLI